MNLILFTPAEFAAPLPRTDPRAAHILDVLRRGVGDTFDAGLIDGPRGKATLVVLAPESFTLAFIADAAPLPPIAPITLILGLPRPQTARKILHAATELGVAAIHFVATEKAEANYAQSSLWSSGEWRRHLIEAAQQAFDPRLPVVSHTQTLAQAIAALSPTTTLLALDNYEATGSLGACPIKPDTPVALALGPERGWGPTDRTLLRNHHCTLAHLGARVLRAETATTAALAVVRAKLGLL